MSDQLPEDLDVPEMVDAEDVPGVTRFHLIAGTEAPPTACGLVRRWCTDRAVPDRSADRIVHLVRSATHLALERGPQRLAVGLRWLDPDRVVLDVRASGCRGGRVDGPQGVAGPAAMVFNAASEGWGSRLGARESVNWFVVDTSA